MGRRAADKEVRLGGGRRGGGDGWHLEGGQATGVLMMASDWFGDLVFVVVFMMVQRRGKELFYRAANMDGAMGKWSGFGAEGTKGIFVWATGRQWEGLLVVGGFFRS